MTLLATSYRYEKMTAKPGLVRALSRQAERVEQDELFADRERRSKRDANTNLISEWSENLEFKSAAKRNVRDRKQIQSELKCAQQSAIMVRREALRHRLNEEYLHYQQELHALGKTYFITRI